MRKTKKFYESLKLTPHEHLLFAEIFKKPEPKWVWEFADLYGYHWNEDSGVDEDDHVFVYDEAYENWIRGVIDDCDDQISTVGDFICDLEEDEIDYFSCDEDKQLKYLIDRNSGFERVTLITLLWYNSSISYNAVYIPYYEKWIIYESGDIGDYFYLNFFDKNVDLKDEGLSLANREIERKYREFETKTDQAFDGLIKFDELDLPY